ncbi:hypothetical protein GCM10009558_086220 [Virgisporangium aurantiacum]
MHGLVTVSTVASHRVPPAWKSTVVGRTTTLADAAYHQVFVDVVDVVDMAEVLPVLTTLLSAWLPLHSSSSTR